MTEVQKYRKKPVEIEAMLLVEGTNETLGGLTANDMAHAQIAGWMLGHGFNGFRVDGEHRPFGLIIETLEGEMRANPGDYIIRGVQGEFYPCKPDIFASTYEPVDRPADVTEYVDSNNSFHRFSVGDEVKMWWGNKRGRVTRIFKKNSKSRWYAVLDNGGTKTTVLASECEKVTA